MLNKFILILTAAGAITAMAATATYKVNILEDTTIAGKQIKAGDYKIQIENNTAVLKHGKNTIEVPAHTESAPAKFDATKIRYVDHVMQEIHVGGTNTKIVFTGGNPATSGGGN